MKKILLILFFLLFLIIILIPFFLPMKYAQFNTLTDLQTYASFFPEFPKSDTKDLENPTYQNFYNQYVTLSFFKKLLIKLRLSTHPVFDLNILGKKLKKVTDYRKQMKRKDDISIQLEEGSRCFIWGDIHGAFHSLIRDLSQLQKMGIINNNLEIIQNVHFIFLGDIISRSPYSVETLMIILLLIDKNPQKVFYLRSLHETNKYWENFNMRKELFAKSEISLTIHTMQRIPLGNEINQFFETLPDALFIIHKNEKIICAYKKYEIIEDVNLKIILSGGKQIKKAKKGLTYEGFNKGMAEWALFSSPTKINQQFYNFYHDTFIELTIGSTIQDSILTLYHRDTRKKEATFQTIYYQAMFGYALKSKKSDLADKKIIRIGSTMALSGLRRVVFKELKSGFDLALSQFNTTINKKLILPVFLDDQYQPNTALINAEKLYNQYKIDIFLMPTGTATLEIYLYMVKSGKIAVFFPTSGSPQFRKSDLKNLINFETSDAQETKALLQHLINVYNIHNFAFFYQDELFPIVKIAHQELKKHGITSWLDVPYTQTQKDFSHIAEKIKKYSPEAIGCFSHTLPTLKLLNQFSAEFFFNRILFGLSYFTKTPIFQKTLKNRGIKMIISHSHYIPDLKTSKIEITKEFRRLLKKYKRSANNNLFEGYIVGSLFIDAINHLKPPFTKEKILTFFEKMKNYNFKGLIFTFNPQTRDLFQPFGEKINYKTINY